MRRIRCAFILGCAAAMALAGCGKGVKDGIGQDKMSDGGSILQSYDSEIKLNDMEAGESGETLNTYWYADGSDSVKLNYRLNTRGGIEGVSVEIDGTEYELSDIEALSGAAAPQAALYDINNDGVRDVILNWTLWRGVKNAIYVSTEDGYTYIPSVADYSTEYKNYTAKYVDDYKLHVTSDELGVDTTAALGDEFVDYDKNSSNWMYDVYGKLTVKDMDAKADAGVDIRYFVKDGKVYVCHRAQFENDGFWCGVSLDRIYGIDGESYVIEEIIVEEEYISGGW